MRVTATTTIRWLKMMNIKDCVKNDHCSSDKLCSCADKLRRLSITKPIHKRHKIILNNKFNYEMEKYKICYENNKIE